MTVQQVCVCNKTPCSNNIQLMPNQNLPHISVYFGNRPLTALIDTGAQVPLIDEEYCQIFSPDELPPVVKFSNKTIPAVGCNGAELEIKGTITGTFQFHQYDDPPLFVEFYLLKNSSQQCIFPHTWLKALKMIINYNTLSLQYQHPIKKGCFLSVDGDLTQANLHKQKFWAKAANDHEDRHDDADCDANLNHDLSDDDDDDDNNGDDHKQGDHCDDKCDGDHHSSQNHNDNDAKDGNDHCPNSTSTNMSQIHSNHPSVTIRPKSSCSRLLNQVDLTCLKKICPGFFHHNEDLCISVWKSANDKFMIHLANDGDHAITVKLCQLRFRKFPCAVRLLPVDLKKWTVNRCSIHSPYNVNTLSTDAIDQTTQRMQSSYSNYSKSLDNLSLNSDKISFTIPAKIKNHPFDQSTSPLTILHVYLLLLLGSNFKYMLKSQEELKEIVAISGLPVHRRTLTIIENLFRKAKVQKMYSNTSLYIVGLVHLLFLDHQRRQAALENNETRQNNLLRKTRSLQKNLLLNIKSTAALYFLNQKLINHFFQSTLQHPYFQQLNLPFSFEQTLSRLGIGNEQDDHSEDADANADADAHANAHDDAHADEDDDEDNDDDDDVDQADDETLYVNALMLHPPSSLPNKSSLSHLINEPSSPYQPQNLSFRQYANQIHETCNSISQIQEKETQKSVFSGKEIDLSRMSPQEIKAFVEYSKSPRRLVDFLQDQIPNPKQSENLLSVPELLQTIPLPRWVIYQSESQILDDYIPNCLRKDFNVFFSHFKDPVFIKYSSIFPLPYPPTRSLLQTDPPDGLHSGSGLVDPKVLASTVSQFLTPEHPLIDNETFSLELLQLACILYSFGNFNVSLHALDTGSFRKEFQVQTLLAPNAPVSSFPSRAATENTDEDLDERLDFLIQQGKCQVILGSPYLNQISSVPKKYKSGQVIHTTKSDPILAYIAGLSDECKTQLSTKSQEISDNQKFLMQLLDDPAAPISVAEQSPPVVVASSQVPSLGQLLDPALAKLQVYDLSKPQVLQFESSIPPTPTEINIFSRRLAIINYPRKVKNRRRRFKRVKFGFKTIIHLTNSEQDVQDRLSFVDFVRFRNNYFMSPTDGQVHEKRYHVASIGTYSRRLVGNVSVPNKDQHDVQFLTISSPNVAQLAKNKLNQGWAKSQQFLANANTIHFCIDQISSGSLSNMISNDDLYYDSMKKLASDPCYLDQAHVSNKTNQNNVDLVKYCSNVTLNQCKQAQLFKQTQIFGNIQIPKQGSQLFSGFVNNIVTMMRRLDHNQPLKAAHHLKRNVLDVILSLDPNLDLNSPDFDYKEISLKQMREKYDDWITFLDKIANHYKLAAIWLFTQVNLNSRYKQDITISEVVFSNLEFITSNQNFIIVPVNSTSFEFYTIRANVDFCREVLTKALRNNWSRKLSFSELLLKMQDQNEFDQNKESQESSKPRFSKVLYHHVNKQFYHKNSIHRIIQASKDSNKLARPILSRAVQSQNDVLKNLGSSELFSNYDLTSGYDALPADPISSLTNTASYRNKEYAFLCASQGGSNSVLFMQRAVCSLMYRIKDEMLLQNCFRPNSIADLEPSLQSKFREEEQKGFDPNNISITDSWICRPNLDCPGPRLLKSAQRVLLSGPRQISNHHILPLDSNQRQTLKTQNKEDRFISSSALVDDLVTSSKAINSEEYRALSEIEKLRIHFKIHIFILLSIFSSIDALSEDPGDKQPFKSSLKLRLEKSVFAATSIRYLNIVYVRGYKAIDLQNFKKSVAYISQLPASGDELRSAIGFFAFLISFVPNLRFHLKSLSSLADNHPAKKSITWQNFPDLESTYLNLCQVVQNNTALHTLPDDLGQIHRFILNADACNASLSYLAGFILSADVKGSQSVQNIRPFKFYSAKLPDYTLNLVILIKEIFAALFAILDNLPQIRLLPPSVQRCLIIDSKPLHNILSKFQKNGYLDTFFTSHPSVPLYLSRLHQLVTENEIQIFVMPTKHSPPADFITRPTQVNAVYHLANKNSEKDTNEISCSTNVTTKKIKCQICPGCQLCCVRKNPHSGCPFSISAAPSHQPNLLSTNKFEEKSVIVDGKTLQFRDNQILVDWDQLEQVSFQTILADSCYKTYLQNFSEQDLLQLSSTDLDFNNMLGESDNNLQQLKLAQKSVSQLLSQCNDNDNNINNDDNEVVSGHVNNDHVHDDYVRMGDRQGDDHHHDDPHGHQDDVNDHHGETNDHHHDDHHHDDATSKPSDIAVSSVNNVASASVNNVSIVNKVVHCSQLSNHQCFQSNFTTITSRRPHSFSFPSNSTVIVFVTQKKRWHLSISHFVSSLSQTAAANLTMNPNQIQELILEKVKYLILCVATDIQEPNSLQMSSLLPNLRRCAKMTDSRSLYYDGNSMMLNYQCQPQNVIQAIQLIARFHPAHHCVVFNSHEKVTKFLSEQRPLWLQFPLLYNATRQQVLSVQLDDSAQYASLCKSVRDQIAQQISEVLPPLVGGHRKCALINFSGKLSDLTSSPAPLDLTNISAVLVKDNKTIKCFEMKKRSRSKKMEPTPQFVTDINLIQLVDLTITQEIQIKTGQNFPTFMIQLKTPLKHDFYAGLISLQKGHCSPIFDGRSISLSQLKQLCEYYPEVEEIFLYSHAFRSKNPEFGNVNINDGGNVKEHHAVTVNAVQLLSEATGDILCQFLGEFSLLYLSQANNQLIQTILNQIRDQPEKQIVIKNNLFQVFDDILYGKPQDKEGSSDYFKPVLPDDRVLPLILKLHSQNCTPPRRIIKQIKQTFCHVYGVTSNISLEKITAALLPCYKCLAMKPAHMTTSLSMQYKSIGLQAQRKKICSIVAIDVFYLADANSKVFANNFISFIICLSCKFLHLKPISRISSYVLAEHLLEFVRITGKTPSILVSDAATTNLFGQMQLLLKDFQLMHVTANHNMLKKSEPNDHDNNSNYDDSHKNTLALNPSPSQPSTYLSTPIHLLSPDQKSFLLQDLSASDPPLYPPVLRHCPVSYKATHLYKQTSLGSLDNACKRLQIFLKKSVTCLPNHRDFKDQIEFLVASFEYQNNFCLEAQATKIIPASLHLGAITTSNILNLMQNIQELKEPKSQQFLKIQELLNHSRKILEAEENTIQKVAHQQATQLREHGKLKQPGDIIDQIKPLDVLFVKSELQDQPKMTLFVNFHGPCLVLGVQPKSEHLILFSLLSGEVLTKNFKQVRLGFSKEIFSIPLFPHLGDEVQFRMTNPLSKMSSQGSAQNVLTNSSKVIFNLHKISKFLAPLLPTYKETQNYLRTIVLSLKDDDDDVDNNDDDNISIYDDPHDDNLDKHDDETHNDNENAINIYVKPSVSFDPSTKISVNDDDDDDDDDNNDDDDDAGRPSVQLHSPAPSSENQESHQPRSPASRPIKLLRPKESVPPVNRQLKYNLRKNPSPSRKYQ